MAGERSLDKKATSGVDQDVRVASALPAGDNNIGNVDLASAIPAGNNNIGDVDVASLPAIPAGNNNIGDVDVATLPGNSEATIFASQARTATENSSDQTNVASRGVHVIIDVTVVDADPSVVFKIQGKDTLSGKYYDILTSAAITGTGTTVLKVYPGITAAANVSVSDILPRTWRVRAEHADADSITYSVGVNLVR